MLVRLLVDIGVLLTTVHSVIRRLGGRPLDLELSAGIQNLKHDQNLMIIMVDKNLGSCAMEKSKHISVGLTEHLLQAEIYKKLM